MTASTNAAILSWSSLSRECRLRRAFHHNLNLKFKETNPNGFFSYFPDNTVTPTLGWLQWAIDKSYIEYIGNHKVFTVIIHLHAFATVHMMHTHTYI